MRKQMLFFVTLPDKTKVGTLVLLQYLDVVVPTGSVPALVTVAGIVVPRPWLRLDHHSWWWMMLYLLLLLDVILNRSIIPFYYTEFNKKKVHRTTNTFPSWSPFCWKTSNHGSCPFCYALTCCVILSYFRKNNGHHRCKWVQTDSPCVVYTGHYHYILLILSGSSIPSLVVFVAI